jgi:hypothetical protein
MKAIACALFLLSCLACQHVPVDPWSSAYDEGRAARLAARVSESVHCNGKERPELRVICAAQAVQRPEPFSTPAIPASLLGVVVSVPESGPFRVRNDFGLPILTIGGDGASLHVLRAENAFELHEADEVIGQIYELLAGVRDEPINLPSDVAEELRNAEKAGPIHLGYARHQTFATFGEDARIFFLEHFAGRPAYAIVMQGETEIQIAVFPLVATRTANPEFALRQR